MRGTLSTVDPSSVQRSASESLCFISRGSGGLVSVALVSAGLEHQDDGRPTPKKAERSSDRYLVGEDTEWPVQETGVQVEAGKVINTIDFIRKTEEHHRGEEWEILHCISVCGRERRSNT
jgi:hypothetical protein